MISLETHINLLLIADFKPNCTNTIFILFIYLFIYTVLIERAIHNSMCSNAVIHNYKRYTQLYMYIIINTT